MTLRFLIDQSDVTVTPGPTGSHVQFPRDEVALASFKARFPGARWDRKSQRWTVIGVLAAAHLRQWIGTLPPAQPFDRQVAREALQVDPIARIHVTCGDSTLHLRFPVSKPLQDALRALPGALWRLESRGWEIPFRRTAVEALQEALPELHRIAVAADDPDQPAQPVDGSSTHLALGERPRQLYPLSSHRPAVGRPTRLHGEAIVITYWSKPVPIPSGAVAQYGSLVLGHEGEFGSYGYFRPATPEEVQELEAAENAAARRKQERLHVERAYAALVERVLAAGERPHLQLLPSGKVLLIREGERWLLQAGILWYLRNVGEQGAAYPLKPDLNTLKLLRDMDKLP
jgi:hypothetical protein